MEAEGGDQVGNNLCDFAQAASPHPPWRRQTHEERENPGPLID